MGKWLVPYLQEWYNAGKNVEGSISQLILVESYKNSPDILYSGAQASNKIKGVEKWKTNFEMGFSVLSEMNITI